MTDEGNQDLDLTRATFRAAFPAIQSAIKVGQDGMRIQFDIPETEMGEAVKLLAMRECVLMVTVSREPKDEGRFG